LHVTWKWTPLDDAIAAKFSLQLQDAQNGFNAKTGQGMAWGSERMGWLRGAKSCNLACSDEP